MPTAYLSSDEDSPFTKLFSRLISSSQGTLRIEKVK